MTIVLGLWPLARPGAGPTHRRLPGGARRSHGGVDRLGGERRTGVHRGEPRCAASGRFRARGARRNAWQRPAVRRRDRDRDRGDRTAGAGEPALPRRASRGPGGRLPAERLRAAQLAGRVLERARDPRRARAPASPAVATDASSARRARPCGRRHPRAPGVLYLTSSRGGFATAFAGLVGFWILTPRRLHTGFGIVSHGRIGRCARRAPGARRLVTIPFVPAAIGQGRSAALLLVLVCAFTGVSGPSASASSAGSSSRPGDLDRRRPRRARRASRPSCPPTRSTASRRSARRRARHAAQSADNDFVRAHLLSGSGSGAGSFGRRRSTSGRRGRSKAAAPGRTSPGGPRTARSPTSCVTRTRSTSRRSASWASLGFVCLVGALVTGLVAGVCRLRGREGSERVLIAALLASFAAWLVAAGSTGSGSSTAVAVVGMLLLGLLTGPATAAVRPTSVGGAGATGRRRFATGVLTVLVVWALIFAQAIPLLTAVKISESQAAVRKGDAGPHSATPRTLDASALGGLSVPPARARPRGDRRPSRCAVAIRQAIDRDPLDWRLWLVRRAHRDQFRRHRCRPPQPRARRRSTLARHFSPTFREALTTLLPSHLFSALETVGAGGSGNMSEQTRPRTVAPQRPRTCARPEAAAARVRARPGIQSLAGFAPSPDARDRRRLDRPRRAVARTLPRRHPGGGALGGRLRAGMGRAAKLAGLYDRDQRSLRHLTVDEIPSFTSGRSRHCRDDGLSLLHAGRFAGDAGRAA